MNSSKSNALLRSLFLAYMLSGILLLALSFALYRLKLNEPQINSAVYGVYVIACLFGGFLAGKAIRTQRFFWGLLTGLAYFAVLFSVSWVLGQKDGVTPDLSQALTVMGCCAVGGMAGGIFS